MFSKTSLSLIAMVLSLGILPAIAADTNTTPATKEGGNPAPGVELKDPNGKPPVPGGEMRGPGRGMQGPGGEMRGPGGDMPGQDGERRSPRMGGMRGGRMMGNTLSPEDLAKLQAHQQAIKTALDAYKEKPNEETLVALKNQVAASVDTQQALEIDLAEKALARAKAQVEKKDEVIERQMKRLISGQQRNQGGFNGEGGAPGAGTPRAK